MSVVYSLTIPRHQQDGLNYCGPACSQMVLAKIGVGLLPQGPLFAECHGHTLLDPTVDWETGPDGLAWTLNHHRPPGSSSFAVLPLGSEPAISRRICWTIRSHQVPPVALIYGRGHWVVVTRYETSDHPTGPNDASYSIDSFDVLDPTPPTAGAIVPSLAPPPPHSAGDECATIQGHLQHVTYADWQSHMSGVPATGHWGGKFIAVGVAEPAEMASAPPPPPKRKKKPKKPKKGRQSGGSARGPGDALLTPDEAAKHAEAGVRTYGLYEREDWGAALSQSQPMPGRLVHRLDHDDSFYSLVSYRSDVKTNAVASVDARSGQYLRAALLPEKGGDPIRLDAEAATELVAGRLVDLPRGRGQLRVRKEAMALYPHLVWRPCPESPSPFYPFYMFTVGDRRIYVRVDGAIFSSLTLDAAGY
jgi:hypothetical protein